jgi:hypothetical protein
MQRKHFFSLSFTGLVLISGLLLLNRPNRANPEENRSICCKKTQKCSDSPGSKKTDLESLSPQFPGSFLLSIKGYF